MKDVNPLQPPVPWEWVASCLRCQISYTAELDDLWSYSYRGSTLDGPNEYLSDGYFVQCPRCRTIQQTPSLYYELDKAVGGVNRRLTPSEEADVLENRWTPNIDRKPFRRGDYPDPATIENLRRRAAGLA